MSIPPIEGETKFWVCAAPLFPLPVVHRYGCRLSLSAMYVPLIHRFCGYMDIPLMVTVLCFGSEFRPEPRRKMIPSLDFGQLGGSA